MSDNILHSICTLSRVLLYAKCICFYGRWPPLKLGKILFLKRWLFFKDVRLCCTVIQERRFARWCTLSLRKMTKFIFIIDEEQDISKVVV